MGGTEPGIEDATRRTYLSQERTVLAWWRSGLAAIAVAIGIGRLAPALLDVDHAAFALLGGAFGVLAVTIFLLGGWRDVVVRRALAEHRYQPLPTAIVWSLTAAFAVLAVAATLLIVLAAP